MSRVTLEQHVTKFSSACIVSCAGPVDGIVVQWHLRQVPHNLIRPWHAAGVGR